MRAHLQEILRATGGQDLIIIASFKNTFTKVSQSYIIIIACTKLHTMSKKCVYINNISNFI